MNAPAPHSIADFREGYAQGHRLRGFRSACGFATATWGLLCPRCGKRDLAEVDLSGRGRIVSGTVQTVPAAGFLTDAPYAYVVVQLEEGARVTGWIPAVADPRAVGAGTPVHWVPSPHAGVQFQFDSGPEARSDGGPEPRA